MTGHHNPEMIDWSESLSLAAEVSHPLLTLCMQEIILLPMSLCFQGFKPSTQSGSCENSIGGGKGHERPLQSQRQGTQGWPGDQGCTEQRALLGQI